ncbi:hypothetical protein DE146DRAFT_633445 [Phaeosphaeria sp. MPI-PUGE-AT-0046c]|nr:hypothetical protein DE146DRAFT_633445 [Phaeosphaeria sp. MPI-PUGE-AT-0046c]
MPKEATPITPINMALPIRLSLPCDVVPSPSNDTTIDHLLERFPRELRDIVYFYLIHDDLSVPFNLNEERLQSPFADPALSAELLEAVFTHRPCRVTFCDPQLLESGRVTPALRGDNLPHRDCIRNLIVRVREPSRKVSHYGDAFEQLERFCATRSNKIRQEWDEILTLPRLESLTIELQKWGTESFTWFNFSPILYQLREHNPRMQSKLLVSFDEIMEPEWNLQANMEAGVADAELMRDLSPVPDDPYLPMGYADVSELIEAPTKEDYAYVEEHLHGLTDVKSRDFMSGLMAETPSHRRLLAQHYVAKEPPLLRVLMAEHYKVYTRINGGDRI